jgi:uncharacterized protein (DUF983 family)
MSAVTCPRCQKKTEGPLYQVKSVRVCELCSDDLRAKEIKTVRIR